MQGKLKRPSQFVYSKRRAATQRNFLHRCGTNGGPRLRTSSPPPHAWKKELRGRDSLRLNPIAVFTRAASSGRSRRRLPVACANALAIAATAGPCEPSPDAERPLARPVDQLDRDLRHSPAWSVIG